MGKLVDSEDLVPCTLVGTSVEHQNAGRQVMELHLCEAFWKVDS